KKMKSTIVILLLSLVTLSAQVTTSQTRPRRLGEAMPEPSPSPHSVETPKPGIETPGSRPAVLNPESNQDLDVVRVETNLVTVPCEPTSDRQKIRKALAATSKGLSTHLYDAMENVMQKHLRRISGRKAIVLFTDGVDATSNHATYESTVNTAEELDALIYPILYDTYDPSIDTGGQTAPPSNSRVLSILRKIPLP